MKTMGFLAICSVLALAAGCGDDGPRGAADSGFIPIPDSGSADAGPTGTDAGPDTGPPVAACDLVGIGCTPDRGCRSGDCQPPIAFTVGGPEDPISGHPMGETTSIPSGYFPGGYCTPNPINAVAAGGCDPDAPAEDMVCGECATCLFLGQQEGMDLSMCVKNCVPSLTEQTCPENPLDSGPDWQLECLLGTNVCWTGCATDDECALYRPDTNMNGTIDFYDAAMNPGGDRLTYDTAGNWRCNDVTNRCEHDGTATAAAGDPCVKSTDCEAMGRCISEAGSDGDFPGGYCIKAGCDVPGNECADGGVCDSRAFGAPYCLGPCTVASTMTAGDIFSNSADCRTGYACFWDGVSGAGVVDGGACIPGNYNAVRTPNIGDDCTTAGAADESLCYSPFGLGQCRDWDGAEGPGVNYCTIFDCGAPGFPSDICGTNGVCASVTGSATTLCLEACTTGDDCGPGYGCWDTTISGLSTGGARVCWTGCFVDADCHTGETCVGGVPDMTLGECTPM